MVVYVVDINVAHYFVGLEEEFFIGLREPCEAEMLKKAERSGIFAGPPSPVPIPSGPGFLKRLKNHPQQNQTQIASPTAAIRLTTGG